MINYVWAGLIVAAVLFAIVNEFIAPPATIPEKTVITEFEDEQQPFSALQTTEEVFFKADDQAQSGASAILPYDFSESDRISLETGFVVESAIPTVNTANGFNTPLEAKPAEMELQIRGDGAGHKMRFLFTDVEEDRYLMDLGAISWEGWRRKTFAFSELVNERYEPIDSVDFPLVLEAIELTQGDNESVTGALYIDRPAYQFSTSYMVADSVASESWMGVLTKSTTKWAELSIELAIGLVGIMTLWLGLMRIAEKAGLVQVLAKMMKPVMVWLYPNIPPEGEAMGAILMNIAANMLGLGNAATPLGLKAMEELQKVNPRKEYASNAMCMLLAMNTSSVTIIPASIFAYRAAAGSMDVMKFWPIMIGTTVISTVFAVAACKILEKLPMFQIPPPESGEEIDETLEGEAEA